MLQLKTQEVKRIWKINADPCVVQLQTRTKKTRNILALFY